MLDRSIGLLSNVNVLTVHFLINLNSTNHPLLMIKCSSISFPNINRVLYKLISDLSIRQKAGRLKEWRRRGGDGKGEWRKKEEKRNWGRRLCNYQYVFRGQRNKLVANGRIWLLLMIKVLGTMCLLYCKVNAFWPPVSWIY